MSNKVLIYLGLWALLTLLEKFFPAQPGQPVMSPHSATDAACLFVNKLVL